jgi:CRP-like cAMP-binding protein
MFVRNYAAPLCCSIGISEFHMSPVMSEKPPDSLFSQFSAAEQSELHAALTRRMLISPGRELIAPDMHLEVAVVLLSGIACRVFDFRNGHRQILAFMLPGELVGAGPRGDDHLGCWTRALTLTSVAVISLDDLTRLQKDIPAFRSMLESAARRRSAITQQWLLNLGRRDGVTRTAHLLCELYFRLQLAGPAQAGECELPITQTELGDALALTPVHVNRVLREIRLSGLATIQKSRLIVHDLEKLQQLAQFDPGYLGPADRIDSLVEANETARYPPTLLPGAHELIEPAYQIDLT